MWADEETIYLRCTAWRHTAQNIAAVLRKGDRILVHGKLRQHTYGAPRASTIPATDPRSKSTSTTSAAPTAQTGRGLQHDADTAPSAPARS
jgi:single-strand DNA-binding protein